MLEKLAIAVQDPDHTDSRTSELETFAANRQTGSAVGPCFPPVKSSSTYANRHATGQPKSLSTPNSKQNRDASPLKKAGQLHHRAAQYWSHTASEGSHDMFMHAQMSLL